MIGSSFLSYIILPTISTSTWNFGLTLNKIAILSRYENLWIFSCWLFEVVKVTKGKRVNFLGFDLNLLWKRALDLDYVNDRLLFNK